MLIEELAGLSLFEGLGRKQLETLAPLFWREAFSAGENVFAQGSEARNIYILESGKVVIRFRPDDGGSLDIETIRPGGVFGWSAALGRPAYTSSAICLTPVRAMATRGSDLRRVMRTDKELGLVLLERMAQVVAHRLEGFRVQLAKLFNVEVEAER